MAPAKRDIAIVFQSYALFPHLSVAENIVFGLKVRGFSKKDRTEKLNATAKLLGLEQLLDRKPSQLSGGQQQRVALGRAIVADKSIFLMDEPLSNLDAKLRAEMREEIRSLQKKLGVTMLYVTHDQVEAVTMADQVVLMNNGKIEQVASPREMYEKPATLFSAKFIGTPPMVTFSSKILAKALPPELFKKTKKLTFGIRPEALVPSKKGIISGEIISLEYLGA
ncbi:MAG: ABC transporter ATP-binding protein, partial [Paracoccaceae bacterium]